MAKVTQKTLSMLEGLTACVVIRTEATVTGDISYTNEPMVLLKIKESIFGTARLVVTYPSNYIDGKAKGKTLTLRPEFTDDKWITYYDAKAGGDSPLNKWIGKKIKRRKPTKRGNTSCMKKSQELIHANQHHMVLLSEDGNEIFLGPDYTNPDDWILAED